MMNTISFVSQIRRSIPSYIQETYPQFTDMIISYYEYLETEGVEADLIRFEQNIYGYRDDPDYIQQFLSSLGFDLGVNLNVEPDLQYKVINDFFSMRGTEPSLKLLFRLLFNEDVNIEYPRDRLLYPSTAHYVKNIFLITTAPDNIIIPDITFGGIVGLTSKSTAAIENIDIIVSPTKRYLLIECSSSSDEFRRDEVIRILADNKEIDVINTGTVDIDVEVCGNGYKLFDRVNISGCIQTGVGYIKSVTYGPIETLIPSRPGTGYKVNEVITASNGFYSKISKVDANGGILEIKVEHGGYNYKEYPDFNVRTANGIDAILTPYGSKVGGVKTIAFENPYALCDNSIISISSSSGYGFQGNIKTTAETKISKWVNDKGILGINCIIQDSDVYHEFSYRIVSSVPSNKYIDLVDKFTHPYGFIRVPVLKVDVEMSMGIEYQQSTVTGYKETEEIDIDIDNLEDLKVSAERELNINVTVTKVKTPI